MYKDVAVPIALCWAETWIMAVAERKILNVMVRCLRSMWSNAYGPSEK